MAQFDVVILGCGFTGGRVADRLRRRGLRVAGTHRAQIDFTQPGYHAPLRELLSPGCAVLHSVPTLDGARDCELVQAFGSLPRRVVYLSTTAVYGGAGFVDERTLAAPRNPRERARRDTERAVEAGPWEALVLRPAAIYGPGRGLHVSIRAGKFKLLGDGSNYVSRIHVDDLAAVCEAALLSDLTGAFPVADDHPCPAREIAEFCARLVGVPMPPSAGPGEIPESRRGNRRVDGSAIRRALGVALRYPSYRQGIPAALDV